LQSLYPSRWIVLTDSVLHAANTITSLLNAAYLTVLNEMNNSWM